MAILSRGCAIALLVLVAPLAAAAQEWPGTPTLLRGADAEAAVRLPFPSAAQRESAPSLHLELSASGLLDPARTILTVEVREQPVRSFRLADLERRENRWVADIALPDVPAGFHAVRLRASLVSSDERCAEPADRARWIRLLPGSALRAPVRATAPGPSRLGSWRRRGGAVRVEGPTEGGAATWLAWIEADHLARAWGFTPGGAEATSTIEVRVAPMSPGVGARVEVVDDALRVLAADPEGLAATLRALRSERVERLCDDLARCDLPPSAPYPTPRAGAASTAATRTEPTAWSLGDAGFAEGWTARGRGEHVLRFTWTRPSSWTLRRWPELHLPVRVGGLSEVDLARSQIELRVAGRPIASWSLGEEELREGRLAARVPEDLWSADAWSFELRVRVVPVDARRCAADAARAAWVSIAGDGALVVPRTERRIAGLAAFAARAPTAPPALELPDRMRPGTVRALAALLWPLAGDAGWQLGDRGPRVRFGVRSLRRVRTANGSRWSDEGALGVPLLDPSDTTVVECLDESCDLVGVALPAVLDAPPPWSSLEGRVAVGRGDRWVTSGAEGAGEDRVDAPPRDEAARAPVPTVEEARLYVFELVWVAILVSATLLGIVWLLLARRRRRRLTHG